MKKLVLLFVLVFAVMSLGASCNGVEPLPTPPVPPDTSDCVAACQKLQSLNCEEGQPVQTPTGETVTCADFCQYEQDMNHVEMNPACVKNITSCSQINTTCAVGHR